MLVITLLFCAIYKTSTQLTLTQIEMGCLTYQNTICIELCPLGQYECLTTIICEYGYFLYNQECVLCPYQNVDDSLTLYCMDCVEHPYTWESTRMCTYEYTIENGQQDSGTYIYESLEYSELYYIGSSTYNGQSTDTLPRDVTYKYETFMCSGCGQFCDPSKMLTCNKLASPYSEDENKIGITCLETYQFNDQMCQSCSSDCLQCQDSICIKCDDGFMIKNKKCVQCFDSCSICYFYQEQEKCMKCEDQMVSSLDQNECEECGTDCQRCEYVTYDDTLQYTYPTRSMIQITSQQLINKYIKRCRQCSTNGIISYDGINCQPCQIKDCQICYYSIRNSITSMDYDFEPLKTGESIPNLQCFQCNTGFILSQDRTQCISPIVTTINKCNSYFYDNNNNIRCMQCEDNIIYDSSLLGCFGQCSSYISYCSYCYSYKSTDLTQYMDQNGQIQTKSAQTLFQCIECDSGYYPDIFTGLCYACPGNCAECWQYSQTYNFTAYIYKMEPIDEELKQIFLNDIPINVQCTECQKGYQLYGNQCLGCTSNCQVENPSQNPLIMDDDLLNACVFKSQFAYCSECYDSFNDRSVKSDKSECISCPLNCMACRDRISTEITNQYFNPDNSNLIKYGRLCYKLQSESMSTLVSVQYNTILNLPILCSYSSISISNTNRCKQIATMIVYIYCNEQLYTDAISQLTTDEQKYHILLDDYYQFDSETVATIYFSSLETFDNYQNMNKINLQQLQLFVKFITDDTYTCYFNKTTIFQIEFHMNVYALNDFQVYFMPNTNNQNITFYIQGDIIWENFQFLQLNNINIFPYESYQDDLSIIINGTLPTKFTLKDSNIGYEIYTETTQILTISLLLCQSIIFENVQLQYFKTIDQLNIDQQQLSTYEITLNNFIIYYSYFYNYNLLELTPFGTIIINKLIIQECTLNSSYIIQQIEEYQIIIANIQLNQIIIKQTYFYDSGFVDSDNLQQLSIDQLDIIGNNFNQSYLFISNDFQITNVYIYSNVITNDSILFKSADQVPDTSIFYQQITNNYIKFKNIKFIENTCYNINCLMLIQTPYNAESTTQNFIMTNLKLYNNRIDLDDVSKFSVSSALIRLSQLKIILLNSIIIDTQLASTVISIQEIQQLEVNIFVCEWTNIKVGSKENDPRSDIQNSTTILYPQNNKIPGSDQCAQEKFSFGSYNGFCLHIQDYLYGVKIQNCALRGLLGLDNSFIYIQSYSTLIKTTSSLDFSFDENQFYYGYNNEVIQLSNINIYNNSIGAIEPSTNIGSIVIISDQQQNIIINSVNIIGNHLHQLMESITLEISSCFTISSPNGKILISNSLFSDNRASKSNYGINVFLCSELNITNTIFNYTNVLQSYWLDRIDENQIINQDELEAYFYINSLGANLYIQSKSISFDEVTFSTGYSQGGTSLYFLGQDTAIITISNTQFIEQFASLEYIDNTNGGALYFNVDKSKYNLTLQNITMNNCKSRSKGGCIFIQPSIYEQIIAINNSIFIQCQSIQSSIIDIEFSMSSKIIPILNINNSKIMNNYFDSFIRLLPDKDEQEEMNIIGNTQLILQNYGILQIENTKFQYITIQGIIKGTNLIQFVMQNVNFLDNIIFVNSIIELTLYSKLSQLIISNIIIFNITEQSLLTIEQYTGCEELTTTQITSSTQTCLKQEELREFYNDIFDYIQITQTKLDNSSIYDYYNTLTITDKYTQDIINLTKYILIDTFNSKTIIIEQNIIQQDNYLECYLSQLYFNYGISNTTSLLSISPIKSNHNISFASFTIQNINCIRCVGGLIQFNNIDSTSINTITINDLQCMKNTIGYYGCLSLTTQTQISTSYQQRRVLSDSNTYHFTISKMKCSTNIAKLGTCISINGLSGYIQTSYFTDNIASLLGGTILFIYNSEIDNKLNLFENTFLSNEAQIGSAIFMQSLFINDVNASNIYLYGNLNSLNSSDIEQIPRKLTIMMKDKIQMQIMTFQNQDGDYDEDGVIDNENSSIMDIINITYSSIPGYSSEYLLLPSGQEIQNYKYYYSQTEEQIPYEWIFRIINLDKNNNQIKSLSNSESCSISGRIMDIDNLDLTKSFLQNFTSITSVSFDVDSGSYILDNLQIYFDPYLPDNLYLQLRFICTSIKIPIYNQNPPYDVSKYNSNYALLLNIKTIPCQVGEAYNNQKCTSCDSQDTYSVQKNSVQCNGINSIQMEEVLPVKIKLRSGYWRPFAYNDNIEDCYNLVTNCNGGWVYGDDSCFTGHIGALCEQCDIYGIRGEQYSVSSKYKCGACADTLSTNVLIIIGISLCTLITMILSVKGNHQIIETLIRHLVLQSIGVRIRLQQDNASIIVKQLTNYLQIIAALSTFRISLPTTFVSSMEVLGNPTQSMAYSLDCFLITLSPIDLLYFRMVWALLMPLIYLIIFFIGYFIGVIAKLAPFKIGIIYTTFIYMFIYLQPTLVGGFIALLSSRSISGVEWIQNNVAYQYYTQTHIFYMLVFMGPQLILWSIIFPLIFLNRVKQNKNNLEDMQVKKKWGFFYHEYTKQAYLWEFVKIFEKEFIIIILTYYENRIVIKGLIIFLIVFIYGAFSFHFIPYKQKQLNYIDQVSTGVCACSLCLGVLIYSSQNEDLVYLQYLMFIIIGILNAYLILLILYHLFEGYLEKFDDKLDTIRIKIKSLYPNLTIQFPSLRRYLINKKEMKERVLELWAFLRYETRQGIKRKRLDSNNPLFIPKRKKSTSCSLEMNEKELLLQNNNKNHSLDSKDQQQEQCLSRKGSTVLKLPQSPSANQGLFLMQSNSMESSTINQVKNDNKIYPLEMNSNRPLEQNSEKLTIRKEKL